MTTSQEIEKPSLSAAGNDSVSTPGIWLRLYDSDLFYSFRSSPLVMISGCVCVLFILGAILAPWIAPTNPYDLKTLDITESFLPPFWMPDGKITFLLGTDDQGAGVLSSILFGARVSLLVGFGSVLFATFVGVALGLMSGYFGGKIDAFIMRVADIQMTFPAILVALLIGGIGEVVVPASSRAAMAVPVLILAIGISIWAQYARTVRGSTMVEKNKEYILAARLIGLNSFSIMIKHVLPNIMGPVLVIATINLAFAIITEATLSFLGVGVSVTQPSLGMLIRNGNDYLFSGEWWIVIFPSLALVILALSVNLLGDWLRDALNPKLR
jgi:peptide/nickel transport system permease protein